MFVKTVVTIEDRLFVLFIYMRKIPAAFLVLTILAGCSGTRKSGGAANAGKNPRVETAGGTPPAFALPGVPMKADLPIAGAAKKTPEAPAAPPAEAGPAEVKPEEAKPAAVAAAASGELDFHLAAAGKYAAKKRYRSAAAEYGAALGFLPAGDARAVRLLERQGAMLLRAGDGKKAQEYFLSAIGKARAFNTSGKDLADSHLGLAYCLEKEKKVQDAISNYEKALELSRSKTVKTRIAKTISDLKNLPK